jgi:transmembrane sensor
MNKQDKIISEAAKWAVRMDAGLGGAEQDAFLDWFTADPRHAAEYGRQRANWVRLDILADWRPEHAVRPNRDLLAPRRAPVFGWMKRWMKKRRRVFFGGALTVAAAACACACACAVWLVVVAPKTADRARNGAAPAFTFSEGGMISSIEQSKLDDGTIVELNRGASITVMYTPTERYVKLEHGEVNFQVAKDPARPFIVNIGGVNVRALGTTFNVRRNNGAVEVLVTSGVVQVHAEDSPFAVVTMLAQEEAFVKAGQMAVVSLAAAQTPSLSVQTVASDKIENLIAWRPRLLDITEQPLSSVVEEFNRRNAPIRLVIADPDLAKTEVSATMRSDQVENFVRLLEGDFRVKAERAGNLVTLYKKKQRS